MEAYNVWLLSHLTQDERIALIIGMKHLEDVGPGKATEQELDAVHSILQKGEERIAKEPCEAWEEYRRLYIRAEILNSSQRLLTRAELDELNEINAWLGKRVLFHLETGRMGPYYLK
jgi:hypothetical protein